MGIRSEVEMTEAEIITTELRNTGTSWTNNKFFDDNGYLYVKKMVDPQILWHPLPEERGVMNYWGKKIDQYTFKEEETQVKGSLARYWHPLYRKTHSDLREIIENIIGRKLYNTYYYDRFYFPGQKLERHVDRDACEISVSIHVSTNIDEMWPFHIKTPDIFSTKNESSRQKTFSKIEKKGDVIAVNLEAGDGVLYKGCERPHWRDPMPGTLQMMRKGAEQLYYHQIFFHYVLQDGIRAHHAWDKCN